jgi:ketol-acid reductoisomerase
MGIAEAAAWCDLIMFTMPDELQAETYRKYVHDNLARARRSPSPTA